MTKELKFYLLANSMFVSPGRRCSDAVQVDFHVPKRTPRTPEEGSTMGGRG